VDSNPNLRKVLLHKLVAGDIFHAATGNGASLILQRAAMSKFQILI